MRIHISCVLTAALVVPAVVAAQQTGAGTGTGTGTETGTGTGAVAGSGTGTGASGAQASASAGPGASAVATILLDAPERARGHDDEPDAAESASLLHGFRLGYVFVANHDEPAEPGVPDSSLAARHGIENPHHFLLGYEVMNRLAGSGWLNVLLIGNFSITGLEQSKLFPSANLLLGFELDRSFQAGVGINLMPVDDKPAHMIVAAGWTPRAGDVYLPLHVFLIPDIDGNHRLGTTFGVNWEI